MHSHNSAVKLFSYIITYRHLLGRNSDHSVYSTKQICKHAPHCATTIRRPGACLATLLPRTIKNHMLTASPTPFRHEQRLTPSVRTYCTRYVTFPQLPDRQAQSLGYFLLRAGHDMLYARKPCSWLYIALTQSGCDGR